MSAQSKRIIKARTKAGLTQAELAKRLKVTRAACSHWEQGISSPNTKHLANLCLILEVNHEWLSVGRGEMYAKVTETAELAGNKTGDLRAAETRSTYKTRKPKADNELAKFTNMFLALAQPEKKLIIDMLKALTPKQSK
ncbi:helix-turn-helix transcriptional regulator [Pseudomonadales bacterium]|nr:helix-turn-helix transcriptional regulator [Pseudomonadales bacterium]MDA8953812.1 helix-turn-helix transcriptional regulator [Pseudomonadales bacterium]MDB0050245.1 helix-turn-helix transcriptional regulator [Pseudomonadales bacterium]